MHTSLLVVFFVSNITIRRDTIYYLTTQKWEREREREIYIYIYIYRERARERERERERETESRLKRGVAHWLIASERCQYEASHSAVNLFGD